MIRTIRSALRITKKIVKIASLMLPIVTGSDKDQSLKLKSTLNQFQKLSENNQNNN